MIRILRSLIGLCNHKWEILDTFSKDYTFNNDFASGSGTDHYVVLQCSKCGTVKKKKL